MTAQFYFKHPPAHYKPDSMEVEVRGDAPSYPKRKELVNMEKFVIDALHGTIYEIPMVTKTNSLKAYKSGPGYTKLSFCKYT